MSAGMETHSGLKKRMMQREYAKGISLKMEWMA